MTDTNILSDNNEKNKSGTDPVLSVQGLDVRFNSRSGTSHALKGISFDIYAGEIVAVVGESGSGKSVTSLALMGLLPESAVIAGGDMIYLNRQSDECPLSEMTAEQRRQLRGQDMAMIFQEPMTSLNPVLKIGDQLTEALQDHHLCGRKEALGKARELLTRVRIADVDRVMNSYPHSLSGGMRQRVMIAQALMCSPRLLIADEPTTALDVTVQAHILQIIKQLQCENNI